MRPKLQRILCWQQLCTQFVHCLLAVSLAVCRCMPAKSALQARSHTICLCTCADRSPSWTVLFSRDSKETQREALIQKLFQVAQSFKHVYMSRQRYLIIDDANADCARAASKILEINDDRKVPFDIRTLRYGYPSPSLRLRSVWENVPIRGCPTALWITDQLHLSRAYSFFEIWTYYKNLRFHKHDMFFGSV